MQRVVIDTNIIVSALIFGGNSEKIVKKLINKELLAFTSPQLISELLDVLSKKFKYSERDLIITKIQLTEITKTVYPDKEIKIARDVKDNKVIEAAVEGKCGFIITGDKDLLEIRKYKRIKILTPREFLDFIE